MIDNSSSSLSVFTEYLINKVESSIIPILKKLSFSNALDLITKYLNNNLKAIKVVCKEIISEISNNPENYLTTSMINSKSIFSLEILYNITINELINYFIKYLNNKNEDICLGVKSLSNISTEEMSLLVRFCNKNEKLIYNSIKYNFINGDFFYSLFNTESSTFSDLIKYEKEFYSNHIKKEIVEQIEEECKTKEYDSEFIFDYLKLVFESASFYFKILLYFVNKENFNSQSNIKYNANTADTTNSSRNINNNGLYSSYIFNFAVKILSENGNTNTFIDCAKKILNVFIYKYNEKLSMFNNYKSKFERCNYLFILDLIVKTINIINQEYLLIIELSKNLNSDSQELITSFNEEMTFVMQDYSKTLKNFVNLLYKNLNTSAIEPLLKNLVDVRSNIPFDSKVFNNSKENFESLIENMCNSVCVSSLTQDNILNTIYYSSISIISNNAKVVRSKSIGDKQKFISLFEMLISNCDISLKTKQELSSNLEKIKLTIL